MLDGRIHIRDNARVAQAAHSRQWVIAGVRVIAVIEIRRYGDEARLRQAVAAAAHELIYAAGMLDYDDRRKRPRAVRHADVAAHRFAVDAWRVPSRWHSDLRALKLGLASVAQED